MEQCGDNRNILSTTPFSLCISSTYWYKLADKKLMKDKSEEAIHRVWGYCSMHHNLPKLFVDYSSFNKACSTYLGQPIRGYQFNRNSKDLFDDENSFKSLIKHVADDLLLSVHSESMDSNLPNLVPFIIYTYSDLKSFKFYYRMCYVTYEGDYFYLSNPKSLDNVLDPKQRRALVDIHKNLPVARQLMYFIHIDSNSILTAVDVDRFIILNDEDRVESNNTYLCIFDPIFCGNDTSLIVRNGLFLLFLKCEDLFNKPLKIILLRNVDNVNNLKSCMSYTVKRLNGPLLEAPIFIELEISRNESPVKFVDLSSTLDPLKLSQKLTYLNLKLMSWNVEPEFDLDKVTANACLLLGAGTLGCSVARSLIGWGFKKFTFVDCCIVSYGNPIRQSLYTFDDSVNKRKKVIAAAEAVKKINPHIEVNGEHFVIPSLGRGPINTDDFDRLERLIESHDVIFLLTDSRESRWLPTLISSHHSKLTITAALGFDSYLVMRHGIPNDEGEKLGCYFCTDIVAPTDSSYGRPLDQQCTVTRTGVAEIASALAVELVISLIHHPERGKAESDSVSCFGRIPHTIRGNLRDLSQMFPSFKAYDKCVACSPTILSEFKNRKSFFLETAFVCPKILEDITGITEMKSQTADDMIEALSDSEEGND